MNHLGITGTDTGVGKTVVASAIIASLRASELRVAPMKPVETGGGDDANQLWAAAGGGYSMDLVRPIAFQEPLAPLVAARRARTSVDVAQLDSAFAQLQASSDVVVVEGAGGLLVPITETETFATLFKRWNLDVVVVAANRLGAVNHTLLTVECARAHGLTVRAVVLNTLSDERAGVAERTNQALLKELLLTIPVLTFPYTTTPHDLAHLAMLAQAFSTATSGRGI